MPLNLNGPEIQEMVDRISCEKSNSLTLEANTKDGVTVTAQKTWAERFSFGLWGRAKSKKDVTAGVKGEIKW